MATKEHKEHKGLKVGTVRSWISAFGFRISNFRFALGFILLLLVLSASPLWAGVMKIELPPETASFKSAAGAELANGQCLVCHSVEYVQMQPVLPRAFWAASVKKMREKYGAAIPDEQVEPLVNYLTRNYGAEAGAAAGTAPEQAANKVASAAPAPGVTAEGLATKYGCFGCHNQTTKIVGPPYKDVALKYRNDAEAFAKIADQIHKGGSGKWGPIIMPPFPMITPAETKMLADWILRQQ